MNRSNSPQGFGRWISGHVTRRGVALAAGLLALFALARPAHATAQLAVRWTAGGVSAGVESAGNAARMAVDGDGNLAIVSGPAHGRDLAVTSYTAAGALRWQRTIAPPSGTYSSLAHTIGFAPDGDAVVAGVQVNASGSLTAVTLARFATDGSLRWRIDTNAAGVVLSVGRLVVDGQGNAYLAYNGSLHKYGPTGVQQWERVTSSSNVGTALSPDGATVVVTGATGGIWRTAAFDTATGVRRWLVNAGEGVAATDVVIDATRVYVAGQGNVSTAAFLTVVAYDRATGARLWRTDSTPAAGTIASGLRIAQASSGGLAVIGRVSTGGYFDWWTVALSATGTIQWTARRDAALTGDEVPAAVGFLADGTTVVTGTSGPVIHDVLGNSYMQGVTVGYGPTGALLWEAFSDLPTVAVAVLPTGDVCATGGYDALVTCFRFGGGFTTLEPVAIITASAVTGPAPLAINFSGAASIPSGLPLVSWSWSFGDGGTATGVNASHVYTAPGTYGVVLSVADGAGLTGFRSLPITVTAAVAPPAPTNLGATAISRSRINLAWSNATTDQTEVRVERCAGVSCTNFVQVAVLPGTAIAYADTGRASRTTYRYRVRALNLAGASPYSNVASARTLR